MRSETNLNNPAGRLYSLLDAFRQAATPDATLLSAWSSVLDCSDQTALLHLAEVAGLVPQIVEAVAFSGDAQQQVLVEHFGRAWLEPVLFPGVDGTSTPSPGASIVTDGALEALGSLSSFLSATRPEGVLPPEDAINALRTEVADLLEQIPGSGLPESVAVLVSDHLHRLLWALDHIRIGGPSAVVSAAERLAGQVALGQSSSEAGAVWKMVLKTTAKAYFAFKRGPELQHALEAWQSIAGELGSGH